MEEKARFYILQRYVPLMYLKYRGYMNNDFYGKDEDGHELYSLKKPENAMRFNSIGDAMRASADISVRTCMYYKVIQIYKLF